MDELTFLYLQNNPKIREYIRFEPIWYRYLSRDGLERIEELEIEAKRFYGLTFPQRMERFNQQLQMASMLMNVAKMMKD